MVLSNSLGAPHPFYNFRYGIRLRRVIYRSRACPGAIPVKTEDTRARRHQQFPRRDLQLYSHV